MLPVNILYVSHIFVSCSYWWRVADSDRLSQAANPELNVAADSGLLYKDAIGQLNLASTNLDTCRASVRSCSVKFSSFTSPDGSEYDYGSSAEFQSFTQLGFPDPQIVSSIPGRCNIRVYLIVIYHVCMYVC